MSDAGWISTCAVAVVALLAAEYRHVRAGIWLAKPLAAFCYLGLALQGGALDSTYGIWVLGALLASWWGDVLLIPRSEKIFRVGVVCFLIGHLGFAVAFYLRGVSLGASAIAAPIAIVVALMVLRWLRPTVPDDMRIAVFAYVAVISTMLVLAIGTVAHSWSYVIIIGASMFYLSDLAVARDRFVAPSFWNGTWGLPLYFGGQLFLAASVSA